MRTRHVSCRHTLWRSRWPARPWPPTIWGTWDLCWPHLCLRRPTQRALSPRWTRRTWLKTAANLRSMVATTMTLQRRRRRITTSWLWHPNVWPWTCPSRSPSLCMPKPSCACCSSGLTCWARTRTTDTGSHYTWTLIAITCTWAGKSSWLPPVGAQMRLLWAPLWVVPQRGLWCAWGWFHWHHDTPGSSQLVPSVTMLWGPSAVWWKARIVRSRQSGAVMAWWLSVVRPTTAGMLRVVTSCPAKVSRRTPIATFWLMRPIAMSWPWGAREVAWIVASGRALADTYTRTDKSGPPCPTSTLKGMWWMTVSTQSPCTCERCSQPTRLPACLLTRWPPPLSTTMALPVAANMRCTTRDCSGLSHATLRLFQQRQVHTDQAAGGPVFSHHDADACSHSALSQPHAAGFWGAGPAGPLPRGAAVWGEALHQAVDHGARSSSTTCRRPMPACWAPGPIPMTRPSSIWSRTSLTKTPATGPSAWMPFTSSCSRTPGTCPRSPTWISRCNQVAMVSWNFLPQCHDPEGPQLHGDWLQPGNAREISPAQHPVPRRGLTLRHSPPNPEQEEGEHKDCLGMAGGVIGHPALAMAAGHCAAGVRHQCPVQCRHCHQWWPQQQWQWGGGNSTAAARKHHHRCAVCRHADAICILAKAQPKVIKQLYTNQVLLPAPSGASGWPQYQGCLTALPSAALVCRSWLW